MNYLKLLTLSFVLSLFHCCVFAQSIPSVLDLRDRAATKDALLADRFENLLPKLMKDANIDMWILIAREYNEDPVLKTMLPSTWLSARRRTILVFHQTEQGTLERIAVARYDVGNLFKGIWNPEEEPNQWAKLVQMVKERNPQRIGLNFSKNYGHADGLTKHEYDSLYHYFDKDLRKKIVSAEQLAVDWLQIRTDKELALYEHLCRIGHSIIAEGLSEKVITPGVTTTEDLIWWFREKAASLHLDAWFHPIADVQRANPGEGDSERSFAGRPGVDVIMPGDLLHVDVGVTYLKLNTDMQQLAYICKPGETDAPLFLKKALSVGNRLQDILTGNYKEGRTGNEILKASLEQAKLEGIEATIYTHPIGYHGHAAGPAVGMWDKQGGVPGTGDYPLKPNTCYAIELNAKVNLPEWNDKTIRVMLEEQAVFTTEGVRYMDGRQVEYLLIPRQTQHWGQKGVPVESYE